MQLLTCALNSAPINKILVFYTLSAVALALAVIVLVAGGGLSLKQAVEREKLSPFECGFSPKFMARLPFSIRFFLLTLVFLIFDVELVLIFPFLARYSGTDVAYARGLLAFFLVLLVLGVVHE